MPDFNIQAIVLRRSQYGETDNILTLYSRERGRISAIAKGARKPISRLSGACEVLNQSKFALASARNLQIVRQAEVISSFSALREDLVRLASALYMADLLSAFVVDGDPNQELYDLLAASLHLVEQAGSPSLATRWFEIRLLGELGYAPVLHECVYCGDLLKPTKAYPFALSASQGGVLCTRHAQPDTVDDQFRLELSSLHLLQRLYLSHSLEDLYESQFLETPNIGEELAAVALRRYIRFRIDRDLKSLDFLDAVGSKTLTKSSS